MTLSIAPAAKYLELCEKAHEVSDGNFSLVDE